MRSIVATVAEVCQALHPLAEALCRGAQGQLGVDVKAAGEVDQREQRLADPALGRLAGRRVGNPLFGLGPLEAGRVGAPLELAGVQKRRQVLGHLGERLARASPLLLALDPVPVS